MLIDFHAHILPALDDGPKSLEESLALIKILISQEVGTIVSTSHFLPYEESREDFLHRRDQAFETLVAEIDKARESGGEAVFPPDLTLLRGAEVYCNEFLKVSANLRDLAIEGTDAMLVELPFVRSFENEIYQIMENLVDRHRLIPVIAHAERYLPVKRHMSSELARFKSMGCMIQINAGSIARKDRTALKILASGQADFIGSDCHNLHSRRPDISEAREIMDQRFGPGLFEEMQAKARQILGPALKKQVQKNHGSFDAAPSEKTSKEEKDGDGWDLLI